MTDTPERVWIKPGLGSWGQYGHWYRDGAGGGTEYVRADVAAPKRYGQVKVTKILAAYNDLRRAVRKGDIQAAEAALDRYEQWADYVFDVAHR